MVFSSSELKAVNSPQTKEDASQGLAYYKPCTFTDFERQALLCACVCVGLTIAEMVFVCMCRKRVSDRVHSQEASWKVGYNSSIEKQSMESNCCVSVQECPK